MTSTSSKNLPAAPLPENPTVGIVTRTKNRNVLLKRALRSVLGQSYPHWRMVIVNDGGSPAEVDALVATHQEAAKGRIEVLHHPQSLGMEVASNAGIARLDTDLLVIHDDDDSWSPEFLAVCVAELKRVEPTLPSVRGVATHCNRVVERVVGSSVEIDLVDPWNDWAPAGLVSFDRMLFENFVPPISFVFRKEVADALGGFRASLPVLGDWDFMVRFLRHHDVLMVPEPLAFYHHRLTATGAMGNTIVAGTDQHRLYRNLVMNEWLREDFDGQGGGLGLYAGLRTEIEYLSTRSKATEKMLTDALQRIQDLQHALHHQLIPESREPVTRLRDIQETLYGQLLPKLSQTLAHVERLSGFASRMKNRVSSSFLNRFIPR